MKKFLIIQTAFIGDVILATALIEKLSRFYDNCEIDFLLRKGNESLLMGNPHVNEVIIWDKNAGKYINLYRTIKKVRKKNYDYVINVHRFATSGIITRFAKAQYKIGFDKNPYSKHFHYKIGHKIGSLGNSIYPHEVDRCLKLIEDITDSSNEMPKLYPSESDYEVISEYAKGKFITISPLSVWETKQFPEEKWIQFCNDMDGTKIYLLGGPEDTYRCSRIVDASENKKIENLAGKLSLLQSAALMEKSKMNYVNDSAPMHLASAMNAPVTAVYCSTIKEFGFGPLSDNSHIVDTKVSLNCRPCGLHGHQKCPEGHFKCAKTIHINQLITTYKS